MGWFEKELSSSVGKVVKLHVFNSRTETYRVELPNFILIQDVVVIPSDSWGGAGVAGLSIRYCSYDNLATHVWHVLDVYPNSPASMAGLQAYTDYVVGSPEVMFSNSEDFFSLIQSTTSFNVPLYVYSSKTNKVRLVSLQPKKNWGGNGCLGCDIGYGYLHQIPTKDFEEKNLFNKLAENPIPETTETTPVSTIPEPAEPVPVWYKQIIIRRDDNKKVEA